MPITEMETTLHKVVSISEESIKLCETIAKLDGLTCSTGRSDGQCSVAPSVKVWSHQQNRDFYLCCNHAVALYNSWRRGARFYLLTGELLGVKNEE